MPVQDIFVNTIFKTTILRQGCAVSIYFADSTSSVGCPCVRLFFRCQLNGRQTLEINCSDKIHLFLIIKFMWLWGMGMGLGCLGLAYQFSVWSSGILAAYSSFLNRKLCTFISGKVCLLASIKIKRRTLNLLSRFWHNPIYLLSST